MNWEIIINSKEVSGGLDILLKPCNDVIRFVLLQFKINDLPKLIGQTSKSKSIGIEYVQILNSKDMDWEDKAWAKDVKGKEIEEGEIFLVHDVIGETIIKEALFDQILYDYGSKVLEIYHLNTSLPKIWKNEMTVSLKKLKSKINNEYRYYI